MYADTGARPASACEWTVYAVFVVLLGAFALTVPEAMVFFGLPALIVAIVGETGPVKRPEAIVKVQYE